MKIFTLLFMVAKTYSLFTEVKYMPKIFKKSTKISISIVNRPYMFQMNLHECFLWQNCVKWIRHRNKKLALKSNIHLYFIISIHLWKTWSINEISIFKIDCIILMPDIHFWVKGFNVKKKYSCFSSKHTTLLKLEEVIAFR